MEVKYRKSVFYWIFLLHTSFISISISNLIHAASVLENNVRYFGINFLEIITVQENTYMWHLVGRRENENKRKNFINPNHERT